MLIRIGVKIYIDGEKFTCVSFSENLDSDLGSGPVIKRTIATFEDSYGTKRIISSEVEE